MKKYSIALVLNLALSGLAVADMNMPGMTMPAQNSSPAMQQQEADKVMAQGEVRNINNEMHTVTIRHGAIPNINMGPMTMVFTARPASLLNGLKKGDKIRFHAIDEKGELVVTKIEKTE